jgi:hypothetical protein
MFLMAHQLKVFYIKLFLCALFAAWFVYGDTIEPNTRTLWLYDATHSTTEIGSPTPIQHSSLYKRSDSPQNTPAPTPTNKPVDKSARIKGIMIIVFGICGVPILWGTFCLYIFCADVFASRRQQAWNRERRRKQQEQLRLATLKYENYP